MGRGGVEVGMVFLHAQFVVVVVNEVCRVML